MKEVNLLGLNGGGARVRLQLEQLCYLHEKLGDKFFSYFDIIAGASGGSLITSLLCVKTPPKQIKHIFDTELQNIFNGKFFREFIGKSKYGNEYLLGLATNLLGNVRLGDLKQKIIIPTVNSSKAETKIFKSFDEKDMNFRLVDVVIASSSAPRYFPSYQIKINDIINWFKDGGLSSNNPSDILALESTNKKRHAYDKVNILSITSGENKDIVTKAEKKGNLLSIPEMIDEMLNLQDKKSHGTVTTLYKNEVLTGNYVRCESQISRSSGAIDDVCDRNLKNMDYDAIYSLSFNKNKLDTFIQNTNNN